MASTSRHGKSKHEEAIPRHIEKKQNEIEILKELFADLKITMKTDIPENISDIITPYIDGLQKTLVENRLAHIERLKELLDVLYIPTRFVNLPPHVQGKIIQQLPIRQLQKVKHTSKVFYDEFSKRCNYLVRKQIVISKEIKKTTYKFSIDPPFDGHVTKKFSVEKLTVDPKKGFFVTLKELSTSTLITKKVFMVKTTGRVFVKDLVDGTKSYFDCVDPDHAYFFRRGIEDFAENSETDTDDIA